MSRLKSKDEKWGLKTFGVTKFLEGLKWKVDIFIGTKTYLTQKIINAALIF